MPRNMSSYPRYFTSNPAKNPPNAIPKSKATKNVELAAPRLSAGMTMVCRAGCTAPKLYPSSAANSR